MSPLPEPQQSYAPSYAPYDYNKKLWRDSRRLFSPYHGKGGVSLRARLEMANSCLAPFPIPDPWLAYPEIPVVNLIARSCQHWEGILGERPPTLKITPRCWCLLCMDTRCRLEHGGPHQFMGMWVWVVRPDTIEPLDWIVSTDPIPKEPKAVPYDPGPLRKRLRER